MGMRFELIVIQRVIMIEASLRAGSLIFVMRGVFLMLVGAWIMIVELLKMSQWVTLALLSQGEGPGVLRLPRLPFSILL